ncbi:hypothetical protein [Clostridium sp. 001]|uniref:hypothetical protein n=1 Tax=Clostridium sp. 001 TaxID=1970093 RepID=UPI001C2C01AF|nr:hypothetical protein [Clostridium sp. 001]QXE20459.1 hypothetical protein B5S50_17330 [Clostridium sp. 001]
MAEERTIQIQDDSGNVYYPQTKSSAVFMGDGKSIDSHLGDATALKTSAKDSFVNAINEVFQSGTNVKSNAISAVNSKGGNLSTSATWDDVINAIKAIAKGQGNAVESEVLGGATFSNSDGKLRTGSMANNGAISGTITNQGQSISIPEGYTKGGSINANFANLIASNIKKDVNIGGITGSLDVGKKYASSTISNPSNTTYKITIDVGFTIGIIIANYPGYTKAYGIKNVGTGGGNSSGGNLDIDFNSDGTVTVWQTNGNALTGTVTYTVLEL